MGHPTIRRALALLSWASLVALPLAADPPAPSPYAGMESRHIPAISPEREQGLRAGAGLGYAMAAELNGHPGPKHVLEMADQLALNPSQQAAVLASFDRMHGEAAALGGEILAAEELLNRRFAHHHIDEATLADLTGRIAELEGRLRFVHLRAHLETDAVLSEEQRQRYLELRGYSEHEMSAGEHHHPG